MRAGTDTLLSRVVETFGEARPHQAYLFANRSATRMKILIHDGIGIWLAARRLHQGHFMWPKGESSGHVLTLVGLETDCDNDTVLVQARPPFAPTRKPPRASMQEARM